MFDDNLIFAQAFRTRRCHIVRLVNAKNRGELVKHLEQEDVQADVLVTLVVVPKRHIDLLGRRFIFSCGVGRVLDSRNLRDQLRNVNLAVQLSPPF